MAGRSRASRIAAGLKMRRTCIQIWNRNRRRTVLLAVELSLCAATGCRAEQQPAKVSAESTIVRLRGIQRVVDPLVKLYREKLPDITFLSSQGGVGMLANLDYLQRGLADVTYTQSDIAYTALTK